MDLENEELKTTRKLNGVAKESNIDKLIKLKEISKRFNNGTETIEDIMYYCRNYEIKFENGLELRVVEKRYFDKLVERIKELEEENTEIKNTKKNEYLHKNLWLAKYLNELYISKQKVKDVIEKILNYKIARSPHNGYYYDYFVKEEYKKDFIKLFNELLEEK